MAYTKAKMLPTFQKYDKDFVDGYSTNKERAQTKIFWLKNFWIKLEDVKEEI